MNFYSFKSSVVFAFESKSKSRQNYKRVLKVKVK